MSDLRQNPYHLLDPEPPIQATHKSTTPAAQQSATQSAQGSTSQAAQQSTNQAAEQVQQAQHVQQAQQSNTQPIQVNETVESIKEDQGNWQDAPEKKKKRNRPGKSVRQAVLAGGPLDTENKQKYASKLITKEQRKQSEIKEKAQTFRDGGQRRFSPYARYDNRGQGFDSRRQGGRFDSRGQGGHFDTRNQTGRFDTRNQEGRYDSRGQGGQDKYGNFKPHRRGQRSQLPPGWMGENQGSQQHSSHNVQLLREQNLGSVRWKQDEKPQQTRSGRRSVSPPDNQNVAVSQGKNTDMQVESQTVPDSTGLISSGTKIALPGVKRFSEDEQAKQVDQPSFASTAGVVNATPRSATVPRMLKSLSSPIRQPKIRETAKYLPVPSTFLPTTETSYINAFPALIKKDKPVIEGPPAVQVPPTLRHSSSSQASKTVLRSSPPSEKGDRDVSERLTQRGFRKDHSATSKKDGPGLRRHQSNVSTKNAPSYRQERSDASMQDVKTPQRERSDVSMNDPPLDKKSSLLTGAQNLLDIFRKQSHTSDVSMDEQNNGAPKKKAVFEDSLKQQTSGLEEMHLDDYQAPVIEFDDQPMQDHQPIQDHQPKSSRLEKMVEEITKGSNDDLLKKIKSMTDKDLELFRTTQGQQKWAIMKHFASSKTRWNKMANYLLAVYRDPETAHTIITGEKVDVLEAEAIVQLAPPPEQPPWFDKGTRGWINSGLIHHTLHKFSNGKSLIGKVAIITDPGIASELMRGGESLKMLQQLKNDNETGDRPTYFGNELPLEYDEVHFPYHSNENHFVAVRIVPDIQNRMGSIEVRDSMGDSELDSNVDEEVLRALADLIAQNPISPMHGVLSWNVVYRRCPQQGNFSDCGPLMLNTLVNTANGTPPQPEHNEEPLQHGEEVRYQLFREHYLHVLGVDPDDDEPISPDFFKQETRTGQSAMPRAADRLPAAQRRTKKPTHVDREKPQLKPQTSLVTASSGLQSQRTLRNYDPQLWQTCVNCLNDNHGLLCDQRNPCSECLSKGRAKTCRLPCWDDDGFGNFATGAGNIFMLLVDILHRGQRTLRRLVTEVLPILSLSAEHFEGATLDFPDVSKLISRLMEQCPQTFVQITKELKVDDPDCIWHVATSFGKAVRSDTIAALHSTRSNQSGPLELVDDLDQSFDFIITTSRSTWGHKMNSDAQERLKHTEELCSVYFTRFASHDPPDLQHVHTAEELMAARAAGSLPWAAFVPNPISSQQIFMKRQDETDKPLMSMLAELDRNARTRRTTHHVLLTYIGWDALTTNNDTWHDLTHKYTHLHFHLTVGVVATNVPFTGYGRRDAFWNGVWFHYSVRYLSKLLAAKDNLHLCPHSNVEEQWERSRNNILNHDADCNLCSTQGLFSVYGRSLLQGGRLTRRSIESFYRHYSFIVLMELIKALMVLIAVIYGYFGTIDAKVPRHISEFAAKLTPPGHRSILSAQSQDFIRQCKFCKATDRYFERVDGSSVDWQCIGGCDDGSLQLTVPVNTFVQCAVCKDDIRSTHMLLHAMKHIRRSGHQCPVSGCTYKHESIGHLRRHFIVVHDVTSLLHKCLICAEKFRAERHLMNHMREKHPQRLNICNEGDCLNVIVVDLNKHNLLCHRKLFGLLRLEDEVLPYKCLKDTCGRSFVDASTLASHTANAHNRKRPLLTEEGIEDPAKKQRRIDVGFFNCRDGNCGGCPVHLDNLVAHRRLLHSELYNYSIPKNTGHLRCLVPGCGKRFHHHARLDRHTEEHEKCALAGVQAQILAELSQAHQSINPIPGETAADEATRPHIPREAIHRASDARRRSEAQSTGRIIEISSDDPESKADVAVEAQDGEAEKPALRRSTRARTNKPLPEPIRLFSSSSPEPDPETRRDQSASGSEFDAEVFAAGEAIESSSDSG